MREENKSLKQRIKDLEDACKGNCFAKTNSENAINNDKLIESLQDQHQQDCIRINDLATTVHVLAGLYSTLRKTVGGGLMEENKKVEETISDRKMKMFREFAQMMDAVWGNDSGTKGLEKFLEQNSSTPENGEDEDD